MTAFIYITVWSERTGTHLVLTISPVELREDIPVRMLWIAPAGVNAHGNPHWIPFQEQKSLAEVSAKYVGAIYAGRTTGWAEEDGRLIEWMDENGAANNINVPDWNNGQWVCGLLGSMSNTEYGVLDTILPERLLTPHGLLEEIRRTHIPALFSTRQYAWKNIVRLI